MHMRDLLRQPRTGLARTVLQPNDDLRALPYRQPGQNGYPNLLVHEIRTHHGSGHGFLTVRRSE